MNTKKLLLAIGILWLVILAGFVGLKEFTLRTGLEVVLKTRPVDPRDLFRGDYVILTYEIGRLNLNAILSDRKSFNRGDKIYVALDIVSGFGKAARVYEKAPPTKPFVRGTVKNVRGNMLFVEYGIESYFVPEGKGKVIERQRGRSLSVVVAIDDFGSAVIKSLRYTVPTAEEERKRLEEVRRRRAERFKKMGEEAGRRRAEEAGRRSAERFKKRQQEMGKNSDLRAADNYMRLAMTERLKRQLGQAESSYKRALALREEALGPDHPDVAEVLYEMASVSVSQRKYAEAESSLKKSLSILEKKLGPDHIRIVVVLNRLAFLYQTSGKWGEATSTKEKAQAMQKRLAGRK